MKNNLYTLYQQQIKNRDTAVNTFMQQTLLMTSSMFEWQNLPDSIPSDVIETAIQRDGSIIFAENNGKLYALQGKPGGELDEYYRPTLFTVANPYLKLYRSFVIGDDCVWVRNNSDASPLLPIIGKFAVLYTDAVLSINCVTRMSRIATLIAASDDKTKASADLFLEKMEQGDFSVIGENSFFKGITSHQFGDNAVQGLQNLIELCQYLKATMWNELGVSANYNMKRERLNTAEVTVNDDLLLPLVDNMLITRQQAARQINEKFNTNINVVLNSAWGEDDKQTNSQCPDGQNIDSTSGCGTNKITTSKEIDGCDTSKREDTEDIRKTLITTILEKVNQINCKQYETNQEASTAESVSDTGTSELSERENGQKTSIRTDGVEAEPDDNSGYDRETSDNSGERTTVSESGNSDDDKQVGGESKDDVYGETDSKEEE